MNEISDLLERIEVPPVNLEADVARGRSALRRRHRLQVSGVMLSVAAVAAVGVLLQGAPWSPGASDPSYLGRTPQQVRSSASDSASSRPIHRPPDEGDEQLRLLQHQLTDPTSQQTLRHYRDVLAEHLDPAGGKLRLAQNEQGGTGHFGTKLDWDGGGMLMISVSTSWRTSDWNTYPPGPGRRITFRGHQARVLLDGSDVWVAVEHDDGHVVMLLASSSFGNNGTSISDTGLTAPQLLDAAADPRLELPYYLR
jgi:hypothetical protein